MAVAVLGCLLLAAFAVGADREERLPASKAPVAKGVGDGAVANLFGTELAREQFAEAVERAEDREEQRKARLESPAAREELVGSRTAFIGLADAAAVGLLEESFGADLPGTATPDLDDVADGRRVEKFLGDRTVVLEGEGDRPPVLVQLPGVVRAADEAGVKRPIDLSLEPRAGGFSPANAAAEVVMPAALEDGVAVGEVRVAPEGSAQAQSSASDEQVVYPNALTDTDVAVKAVTSGVELFWQLRSPRAPEELMVDVEVPTGAFLDSAGESGAVAVVRDGEVIATVSPPLARDAQGRDVAVDVEVRGAQIALTVAHRDQELAYPLLVDPVIEDWHGPSGSCSWFNQCPDALADLGYWQAQHTSNVSPTTYLTSDDCREGLGMGCFRWAPDPYYDYYRTDGLHYYMLNGTHYPTWSSGSRVYTPPGTTTRIDRADFGVKYMRQNSTGARPFMFTGIWVNAIGGWAYLWTSDNPSFNNHWNAIFAGGYPGPQSASFGFAMNGGATINASNQGYMGAAIVQLTDPEPPTITDVGLKRYDDDDTPDVPVTGAEAEKWISGDDVFIQTDPTVTDPGLGVWHLRLWGPNTGDKQWDIIPCQGGRWDPCPASTGGWSTYENDRFGVDTGAVNDPEHPENNHGALPDGRHVYTLQAMDVLQQMGTRNFEIKIDRTRPTIGLSGALWNGREDPAGSGTPVLGAGTHALSIAAADPAPPSAPGAGTSGVRKIVVKVDGEVVDPYEVPCAAGGCSRNHSWNLDTAIYGGKRTVRVEVTDEAGNVASKAFVVNLPSRGELVLPVDGESTSSRLALLAQAHEDGFSGVEFQYREMPGGLWKTIGGSGTMLRDDLGNVVSATSHPLDQPGRRTKKLIWDARTAIDLAMLTPKPGPLQVRAVFAGNGGYTAKAANVELDASGLSAGNAQTDVGPGTLDLLTGNFSYSATDAALSGSGKA